MAKELLNTSVSLEYADEDGAALVLQEDTVEPPYGFAFVRLYFANDEPSKVCTSGHPVQTINRQVVAPELAFINFQGTFTSSFPTPGVSNARVNTLGRLLGMEGETLSRISLTVDPTRGTLTANQRFFGTVHAEYDSTYHRLQCQFREIPGAAKDDRYPSKFSPMVLVCQQQDGNTESITLNPPNKDKDPDRAKGGYTMADKAEGESLVLEIDDTFPISLAHASSVPGLHAVARVLVYSPHSGVTFSVSRGYVQPDAYSLSESLPMVETVNFIGAQSASTKYPPANGVTASPVGEVTSKQTPGSLFRFATAPEDVAIGDWFSYGAYRINGMRRVAANEIVSTTAGVTVPVTGQAKAVYNTVRTACNVFWPREGDWFSTVVLTATDPYGNVGSITINPPERRGR